MFAEATDGLAFALLPAPTGKDPLALLARVIRRVTRRLARDEADDPGEADNGYVEKSVEDSCIVSFWLATSRGRMNLTVPSISGSGGQIATAGARERT